MAKAILAPGRVCLPAAALTALPRPVAIRAVKSLLLKLGRYAVSSAHLDQILALAESTDPSARLSLPDGLSVQREYGTLLFSLLPPPEPLPGELRVTAPGVFRLENGWTVTLTEGRSEGRTGPWLCDLLPPRFPLTLRGRQTGDRLTLPGRPGKSLKKWYIDEKIPRHIRDGLPVLAEEEGVLAVAGLGPQAHRAAEPGEPALTAAFLSPDRSNKTGKEETK